MYTLLDQSARASEAATAAPAAAATAATAIIVDTQQHQLQRQRQQ
jgi:hypothetical protein